MARSLRLEIKILLLNNEGLTLAPHGKLRRYSKMWRKYNCNVENQPNEEKQIKFLEKYMTNGVSRQRAKGNKKIAIRNIENFLKAAKP